MTKDEREFLGRGCAAAIMVGTGAAVVLGVIVAAIFFVVQIFR